jgi:hypothetical protein
MGLGLMDIHRFGGNFHTPPPYGLRLVYFGLVRESIHSFPYTGGRPHAPIMTLEHEARLDIRIPVMKAVDSHLCSSILPEEPSRP